MHWTCQTSRRKSESDPSNWPSSWSGFSSTDGHLSSAGTSAKNVQWTDWCSVMFGTDYSDWVDHQQAASSTGVLHMRAPVISCQLFLQEAACLYITIPRPKASYIDAVSVLLLGMGTVYAFPPYKILLSDLAKICQSWWLHTNVSPLWMEGEAHQNVCLVGWGCPHWLRLYESHWSKFMEFSKQKMLKRMLCLVYRLKIYNISNIWKQCRYRYCENTYQQITCKRWSRNGWQPKKSELCLHHGLTPTTSHWKTSLLWISGILHSAGAFQSSYLQDITSIFDGISNCQHFVLLWWHRQWE